MFQDRTGKKPCLEATKILPLSKRLPKEEKNWAMAHNNLTDHHESLSRPFSWHRNNASAQFCRAQGRRRWVHRSSRLLCVSVQRIRCLDAPTFSSRIEIETYNPADEHRSITLPDIQVHGLLLKAKDRDEPRPHVSTS
jgi:hypothetical protein